MSASAGVQTELMTSIYGITQAQLDQEQTVRRSEARLVD